MGRARAASALNAMAVLAGLLIILAIVMGGYTLANPQTVEDVGGTDEPYAVSVDGDRLVVEKHGGDPVTYDQLLVYLSAGEERARLDIDEDHSRSRDTDGLFEEGERVVRPLPWADPPADTVSVTLVDSVSSELLYETTVAVAGNRSV